MAIHPLPLCFCERGPQRIKTRQPPKTSLISYFLFFSPSTLYPLLLLCLPFYHKPSPYYLFPIVVVLLQLPTPEYSFPWHGVLLSLSVTVATAITSSCEPIRAQLWNVWPKDSRLIFTIAHSPRLGFSRSLSPSRSLTHSGIYFIPPDSSRFWRRCAVCRLCSAVAGELWKYNNGYGMRSGYVPSVAVVWICWETHPKIMCTAPPSKCFCYYWTGDWWLVALAVCLSLFGRNNKQSANWNCLHHIVCWNRGNC